MATSNVDSKNDIFLRESVQYYLENKIGLESIWRLSKRGLLFDFFQKSKDNGDHIKDFCKEANIVLEKKRESLSTKKRLTKKVSGKCLLFCPSATMYDCLAEELTEGFFDSGDCPPPEFWVRIENENLLSFIPGEYVDIASIGVENCMSGCLEWVGSEISVG